MDHRLDHHPNLTPHPVGTNPMSRIATMAAICSESRFEISSYIRLQERYDWSVDWSRTPEGRFFSNKAPGASLLAAPLFCIVDRFYGESEPDVTLRIQKQYQARWAVTWIASLLLQILPLAFLVFWIDGSLGVLGYSDRLRRFVQLALLFGHTGAVYMNSWWGHGLSVVLGLATFLTLQSKRWVTAGFMMGLALLNDYSMALMIPGFLFILWQEEETKRDLVMFMLGGVIPGFMWILYHTTSFGSPFTLPNAFQNPLFIDPQDSVGGWHGDNTVGPRYLSPILPFFALWLVPVFDHLSERLKKLLEFGLVISLILFITSYTISLEPPTPPLWMGFYKASFDKDALTLWSRFLLQIMVLAVAFKLETRSRCKA
ncbi:MAG: hypothetical protein KA715_14230 [Xanthomonadaceae bacterium]|nr:hypothetical protein [Xanthomonadaceae bacterium]